MRRRDGLLAAALGAALPDAGAQTAAAATAPRSAADAFAGLGQHIAQTLTDVRSVVVLQHGVAVFQHHRSGLSPITLHPLASVTKSVLSLLAGIALGQGRVSGLEHKVLSLLPGLADANPDPRAQRLTLRHLLTMTAGYVQAASTAHSPGGPPVGLAYGLGWWVAPGAAGSTYLASGFGGQLLWVHAPLGLAVAVTSEVSAASHARGQAVALARGPVLRGVLRMAATAPR